MNQPYLKTSSIIKLSLFVDLPSFSFGEGLEENEERRED